MAEPGEAKLNGRDHPRYRAMIGVGGIGSGLFFALEGNQTLGRNESRQARLIPAQDYCKLHIVAHYVAALVGAEHSGTPFDVIPIGKVGNDSDGLRLKKEMAQIGMDTGYVDVVDERPTLLSICYQYPDQSGGNITTSDSAAASLTNNDVDRVIPLFELYHDRFIALAVPEVSLAVRNHFLTLATAYGAWRVGSFTSAEILDAESLDLISMVDLLAINEDEAAALIGRAFNPNDPQDFLDKCAIRLTETQPRIKIVISAGKEGVFAFADEQWFRFPALAVKTVSTTGAGDALLAGIISGLVFGLPFINRPATPNTGPLSAFGSALDLGVLLARFSVTSSHTIHPDASMSNLLDFAGDLGLSERPLKDLAAGQRE